MEKVRKNNVNYPRINDCLLYIAGLDQDMLLKGIVVKLDFNMNSEQCRKALLNYLKPSFDISNKIIHIFLPGGIPFVSGNLSNFFLDYGFKAKKVLYGVLTRQIPDTILQEPIQNICNISDSSHRLLISPICDSTNRGLSDMACLIGYLNYKGLNSNLLLKTCASVIHFPPLTISMFKIINGHQRGLDIVTVCATLYTFIKGYLQSSCPDDQVLEYCLKMCNVISNIDEPVEDLPIRTIDRIEEDDLDLFLSKFDIGQFEYFWSDDFAGFGEFQRKELKLENIEIIENSYEKFDTFTPISCDLVSTLSSCMIVEGERNEFLFIKKLKDLNKIEIIDPTNGSPDCVDIDVFGRSQSSTPNIDEKNVQQIIMVNLDASTSISTDFEDRFAIAYQYLTTFISKVYGYNIRSIQGLVTFNNIIDIKCPLSPLVSDFESKGLSNINLNSKAKLWDSLNFSCDEIVKYRYDTNGNDLYKKAVSRILVISFDEDSGSLTKVEDVVKKLIVNNIIVDSFIINNNENKGKMLCAVSHITNGFSFHPINFEEGNSMLSQRAFHYYNERVYIPRQIIQGDKSSINKQIKPNQITEEFMNKAKENSLFDKRITDILSTKTTLNLLTPHYVMYHKNDRAYHKNKRILKELELVALVNNPSSPIYDPDLKIFPANSQIDFWNVYIKAPEGSLYGNKWWFLVVDLSHLSYFNPPIIKFVSIPYHLNVSEDGFLCDDSIFKKHHKDTFVVNLLQRIKNIFLIPNLDSIVELSIYDLYIHNREKYKELAIKSSKENAKDDYRDYLDDKQIDNAPYSSLNKPKYSFSDIKIIKPVEPIKRYNTVGYIDIPRKVKDIYSSSFIDIHETTMPFFVNDDKVKSDDCEIQMPLFVDDDKYEFNDYEIPMPSFVDDYKYELDDWENLIPFIYSDEKHESMKHTLTSKDPVSLDENKKLINIKHCHKIKQIGQGNFGEVFEVEIPNMKKHFAVKIFYKDFNDYSKSIRNKIKKDISILIELDHPSFLKYYKFSPRGFGREHRPSLLSEYYSFNSLSEVIKNNPTNWTDTKKLINIYGIASAMSYLHSRDILHRRLYASNVLVDQFYNPKVCDFLFTDHFDSIDKIGKVIKMPKVCLPESLNGGEFTKKSDVYFYGFLVYHIMTNEPPFDNLSPAQLIINAINSKRPELKETIPHAYIDLIERCWNEEADQRPTFNEIIHMLQENSDFITEKVDKIEYMSYIESIRNWAGNGKTTANEDKDDKRTKKQKTERTNKEKEEKHSKEDEKDKDKKKEEKGGNKEEEEDNKKEEEEEAAEETFDEYTTPLILNTTVLKLEEYEKINKIGHGGFSKVFKIKEKRTGNIYAAKVSLEVIHDYDKCMDNGISLSREVSNHSRLRNPAVLKFIGYSPIDFKRRLKPTIVVDHVSQGSLRDILHKKRQSFDPTGFDDTTKLIIIYGIASSMSYLHSLDILHLDLKPNNILIDDLFHPILSDFGCSITLSDLEKDRIENRTRECVGTIQYIPLEVYKEYNYSKKGDVYAFSLIVYELLTNQEPFFNLNQCRIIQRLVDKKRPIIPDNIEPNYRNLIEMCWSEDPCDRPSFETICKKLESEEFVTKNVNKDAFHDYIKLIRNQQE